MPGLLTPNPLKFVRQHDEPLDVDFVFSTTAARNAYLSDARRYAGQIVADVQEEKAYMLNAAKSAWIELGTGSGGSTDLIIDFTTSMADTGIDLPGNSFVKYILVKCAAGLSYSLGVSGVTDLFINDEPLLAGIPATFVPGVFIAAAIRIVTNAPATAVHVKIIYQTITI